MDSVVDRSHPNYSNIWNQIRSPPRYIDLDFLPKFKLQLYGISVKVPNRFFYDFVAQRFISSHAHPNGIFASARESRVVW